VSQPQSESLTDKTPWQAIADALKQGPTLPKIELMKFGGDPSEYGEFVATFRNHVESQVSDDSQSLTHLFAQCRKGERCYWAIPFNIRTPPVEEQWNSSGVRDKSSGILQG